MRPGLKRIVDFILGEPRPKAPVKPKVSTVPPPEKATAVNDQSGEFFKDFLLQIYGQSMFLARQKGLYDHYDVLGRENDRPTGNSCQ